jgi:hypothetical protein
MKRREFMAKSAASGVLLTEMEAVAEEATTGPVVIERPRPGTPHSGKVLAAIQPHSDDIPLCAGEFVLKQDREVGRKYELHYAEEFHHIENSSSPLDEYLKQHAVSLK